MLPPNTDPFLALQEALKGRYWLERELGRGGMGIVYLADEVAPRLSVNGGLELHKNGGENCTLRRWGRA